MFVLKTLSKEAVIVALWGKIMSTFALSSCIPANQATGGLGNGAHGIRPHGLAVGFGVQKNKPFFHHFYFPLSRHRLYGKAPCPNPYQMKPKTNGKLVWECIVES